MSKDGFLNNFLRFDKDAIITLFDFETEGLNLHSSRAWQAGILVAQDERIISEHNLYIKWDKLRVSPEAARITGFNPDVIRQRGIDPNDAIDILEDKFQNCDFVLGHNIVAYDYTIYRSMCRILKRKPMDLREKMLDTFLFAKAIKLGIPFRPDIDRYSFFLKLYSEIVKRLGCSLGVLAKEYGFDVDPTKQHDAIYDLKMNLFVWNKIKWNIPV